MANQYKNFLELVPPKEGNEARLTSLERILENGTFLPKTVLYKDIDEAFQEWSKNDLKIVSDEGIEFPTMALYSNQRFSEYSQSWKYTDENNNLILNFKTVSRENNPQKGDIVGNIWNIPGDRFYLMKRTKVLDDNGTESFLDLEMRIPTAINFNYKLSIFTTKYQFLNEFNTKINRLFNARQVYLFPNGHPMPMTLDGIGDESQYNIDDRQYYSQTYTIKLMGYVITEDDYRVSEKPIRRGINFDIMNVNKKKIPIVEVEECEKEDDNPYEYQAMRLTITFTKCSNVSEFTYPEQFVGYDFELKNIYGNYKIFVNNELIPDKKKIILKENDIVKIEIKRVHVDKDAIMTINGYNPEVVIKK